MTPDRANGPIAWGWCRVCKPEIRNLNSSYRGEPQSAGGEEINEDWKTSVVEGDAAEVGC